MQKPKSECEHCKRGMLIVIGLLAFITVSLLIYGFLGKKLFQNKLSFCNSPISLAVESYNVCGDYVVLDHGCCDIPQTIVDREGTVLDRCGGLEDWSDECKQRYSSKTCRQFSCRDNADQTQETATKDTCQQTGGTWQKWGLRGTEYCQYKAVDSGKECSDGSACSLGKCIMGASFPVGTETTGECQTYKNTFGCLSFIENGRVSNVICID